MRVKNYFFARVILSVLILASPLLASATDFVQVASREGAQIGLTQTPGIQPWIPEPMEIEEQFFGISPPHGSIEQIAITGKLKLNDRYRINHPGNWRVTITYDIQFYDESNTLLQTNTGETLSITYFKQSEYVDHAQKKYQGSGVNYHKAVISITQIENCLLLDNGGTISCGNVNSLDNDWQRDISLEWECTSSYLLDFDQSSQPSVLNHVADGTVDAANVCESSNPTNIVRLAWDYIEGAVNYDVEWLHLDIPATYVGGTYTLPSSSQNFEFDWRNATRINITGNFYDIPLLYPTGVIVYRIRGIGAEAGGARLEGTWSQVASGSGNNYTDNLNNVTHKFVYCGLKRDMNWTASITFAEEGKRKGVANFVDGTGRTRQTITALSTDQNTIVAGPSLDQMGRPSVNYLPVPVKGEAYTFYPDFNGGFGADVYDVDAAYPSNAAVSGIPGSPPSAVNDYYSSANPFISLSGTPTPYEQYLAGMVAYTPNADSYPFTQTRMTNDGSGRPHSTSGVGATHALGGGHDTKFYYGTPGSQAEVDRLFGSEAGFVSYYRKNMTVDPNGQISVTYLDGYGRTVATALAGTGTKDLLVSIADVPFESFTGNLLANNELLGNNTITATKDITVAVQTDYSFSYSISETEYQTLCVGDHTCHFEFLITVKDDEGNEYNPDPTWKHANNITMPYETTITLPPGKYTISKVLRVKEEYVQPVVDKADQRAGENWQTTVNTCFTPPFVSGCFDCETQCANGYKYEITYNAQTYTIYRNLTPQGGKDYTTNTTVQQNVVDENGNPIYDMAPTNYVEEAEQQIGECIGMCGQPPTVNMGTECEMKRVLMLRDLLPDGQYFENRPQDPSYSGVDNPAYTTGSESNPANRNAWLEAYASDLKDDFGAVLNPSIASPSWEDIRANWETIDPNDPMFELLKGRLFRYHPEYCLWKSFCGAADDSCECKRGTPSLYGTPQNYASVMANTNSDLAAMQGGLFAPTGDEPVIEGYSGPFNHSAYFDKDAISDNCFADPLLYCNREFASVIYGRLKNHTSVMVGSTEVPISVWYLIDDPESLRLHDLSIGSHPTYPDAFVEYIQTLHGSPANPTGGILAPYNTTPTGSQISRWQYFRSVYTFHRMQIQYQMAAADAAECMDCANNNPIVEYPLCGPLENCTAGACEKLPFFSVWDYDDDGYMDMGTGNNSFSFNGMELRYPYINLMANAPTGPILMAEHCETNCSSLATQWINQMQNGIRACVSVGTDPSNPSLVTTPVFVIPEVDKIMLRAYFINICSHACEDQAGAASYSHDYTSYPFSSTSDWSGPEYTMGHSYSGSIIQNVNQVVSRYMQYNTSANGCPVIINSIPVSGVDAPDLNELSCSCDNLSYFLSSNAGILKPNYVLINPLKAEYLSGGLTNIFDFAEMRTQFEALDVAPNNLSAIQGLSGSQFRNLVMGWISACNTGTSIPPVTIGLNTFSLPSSMDCSDNPETDFPAELDCAQTDAQQEDNVNSAAFAQFKQNLLTETENGYRTQCLKNAEGLETFTMTYELQEHHYTLYYYDQAGNLVKTVPPAGVDILSEPQLTAIHTFRKTHHHEADYADQSGFVWPNHTLATHYIYNGQNQMVQQNTPDAGITNLFYDALGRVISSQNAQQKANNKLSYILYDALGRITEIGEIQDFNSGMTRQNRQRYVQQFAQTLGDPTPFESDIESQKTAKTQIIVTKYDRSYLSDFGLNTSIFPQNNLRNQVSSMLYYATYPMNDDFKLYDNANHYSYDIHGNIDLQIQDIPALQDASRRFLMTNYEYDLVSGKTNAIHYMKGYVEQFSHYYRYDADNRVISTYTSKNGGIIKELETKYFYYPTGPLARVELGRNQVQGIDYAYSLQGWVKGVNADIINTVADIGRDANYDTENMHTLFGMDAAGYTLGYHQKDYSSIGTTRKFEAGIFETDPIAETMHPNISGLQQWGLYNGNISKMAAAGLDCGGTPMEVLGRGFMYDQLNRIVGSTSFTKDYGSNFQSEESISWYSWNPAGKWNNSYTYDPNGNITKLYADAANGPMDNLSYTYAPNTNRLLSIKDLVASDVYGNDVDDFLPGAQYGYDLNGNLTSDPSEHINNIEWNVYGKVKSVSNANIAKSLWMGYNPNGQRIAKIVGGSSLYYTPEPYKSAAFYALDAQGNIMAIYDYKQPEGSTKYVLNCSDQMIYGSSRIGTLHRNIEICTDCVTLSALENSTNEAMPPAHDYAHDLIQTDDYQEAKLGTREYEFTNHLGNVLATFADRKVYLEDDVLGSGSGALVFQYRPAMVTAGDYYPFGMKLPGRGCPPLTCDTIDVDTTLFAYTEIFDAGFGGFIADGTTVLANTTGALEIIKGTGGGGMGAHRTIDVQAGILYTFNFKLTNETCKRIVGTFPDPGTVVPVAAVVNVKDGSGNIVATGSYDYSGTYTLTFTPAASGSYTIEFMMPSARECSFFVDDISISFPYSYTDIVDCSSSPSYRFGFNGQEKDNEIYGEASSYTAEFWQYDPRIGRRWNLDPVDQISISNYATFGNNPILYVDIKGDDHVDPKELKENDNETYNDLISDWERQTGLKLFENENGMLDYQRNAKGKAIFNKEGTSSIARKQLMNAIDDKRTVYLGVGDESMTFSPTTEGNPMPGEWRIQFSRKQIMGFAEDWQGDERYKYTVMNVGIVGFHELIHFNTQYADNESGDRNLPLSTWTPGIVVRQENAIRKQLGELYLQRLNYSGSGGGYNYVFFSPENIPLNDIKKAIRLNRMTPEYEYSNPGNYIKTYVGKSASRIGRE